ncbi:MAG: hypothetical protein KGO03_02180 [Gemmatimonadota bacterium]|nr:hypothetical protein [Gemmatimonadota bacterium]
MTRTLLRLALLTVAFALGTYAFGWWAVPAVAAAWGLMNPAAPRTAVRAATAALVAWLLLLFVPQIFGAPIVPFGIRLSAAMRIPAWALWTAECAFPLALAWSAAALAAALRGPDRSAH